MILMYYEYATWQKEPTLTYITEECDLLDCATEEEIERVGKFITSHICTDYNMQKLSELIASYSKPPCDMVNFVAWILTELSNNCVSRFYVYQEREEKEHE